jgi:hypothetical protein
MNLRKKLRARRLHILVAGLAVAGGLAIHVESDAMRPRDPHGMGCWTEGPGQPFPFGEPMCIPDSDEPSCYICVAPSEEFEDFHDVCAVREYFASPVCDICEMPDCPSWP